MEDALISVTLKCQRRGTSRGQPEQQVLDGLGAWQMGGGDAGQGDARGRQTGTPFSAQNVNILSAHSQCLLRSGLLRDVVVVRQRSCPLSDEPWEVPGKV